MLVINGWSNMERLIKSTQVYFVWRDNSFANSHLLWQLWSNVCVSCGIQDFKQGLKSPEEFVFVRLTNTNSSGDFFFFNIHLTDNPYLWATYKFIMTFFLVFFLNFWYYYIWLWHWLDFTHIYQVWGMTLISLGNQQNTLYTSMKHITTYHTESSSITFSAISQTILITPLHLWCSGCDPQQVTGVPMEPVCSAHVLIPH